MSAGYTLSGLGASSLRPATRNNGVTDVYVSVNHGDDLTGLGTPNKPLKTLEFTEALLPDVLLHPVNVHLDSGQFFLPPSGTLFRPRVLGGLLKIFGDASWDPAVNVVLRSAPAGVGTTTTVVKQAGLVPNLYIGKTLEVTTGGIVQRKTVRDNTATDIIPCGVFDVLPLPGDTVRILESSTQLIPPVLGTPATAYRLVADQIGAAEEAFNGGFPGFGILVPTPDMGVLFENMQITLNNDANFFTYQLCAAQVFFYGVEILGKTSVLRCVEGSRVAAGTGLDRARDYGWGLGVTTAGVDTVPAVFGGSFTGCVASVGLGPAVDGGKLVLFGGHCEGIASAQSDTYIKMQGDFVSSIAYVIDARGFNIPALLLSGARQLVEIGNAELHGDTGGVHVKEGAAVRLAASTVGDTVAGNAVLAETGGTVYTESNPVFGGAGGTWKTTNTVATTRAAFVPGFALTDPTDTSSILAV